MKKKVNLHQQAAEKAKANILQAAQSLFVEKGFSGTSMGSIAKAAEINQSLVYHYFEGKEDLWRQVKTEMVSTTLGHENLMRAPQINTLDELLDHLLVRRFELYAKNPNLVRMLMWQALEEQGRSISGTSEAWMESWIKEISSLQKRKIITSSFTPVEILLWLNGIVWAPFVTKADAQYLDIGKSFCQKMIKELRNILQVKKKV